MTMTDTTKDYLHDHRVSRFVELGFNQLQSEALADARGLEGFHLSHHDVRKYLDQGCSKDLIIRIFAD